MFVQVSIFLTEMQEIVLKNFPWGCLSITYPPPLYSLIRSAAPVKSHLHNINLGMGISVLNPNENSCPDLVNSKKSCWFVSSQASYTESNFTATADLKAIARMDPDISAAYPRFPLRDRK